MSRAEELKLKDEQCAQPLRRCVENAVGEYLKEMEGARVRRFYSFVITEVEKPLLETLMKHVGGNQSKASLMLGISRSTLRKKLQLYEID